MSDYDENEDAFDENKINEEIASPDKRVRADAIERLARKRAGAKLGWYMHAGVYLLVNLLLKPSEVNMLKSKMLTLNSLLRSMEPFQHLRLHYQIQREKQ